MTVFLFLRRAHFFFCNCLWSLAIHHSQGTAQIAKIAQRVAQRTFPIPSAAAASKQFTDCPFLREILFYFCASAILRHLTNAPLNYDSISFRPLVFCLIIIVRPWIHYCKSGLFILSSPVLLTALYERCPLRQARRYFR